MAAIPVSAGVVHSPVPSDGSHTRRRRSGSLRASIVDLLPFLTWRDCAAVDGGCRCYYAGLIGGWILWRRRVQVLGSRERRVERAARLGASVVAACAAIWIVSEPRLAWRSGGDGRLRVTFVDVGQGDSALLSLPNGSTLLIDAGGLRGTSSFDIGDRVVAPILRHQGVHHLEAMVVTHGDHDHAGGALALLREFRPRDLWEGIPVPALQTLRDLRTEALAAGARWVNVQSGDLVSLGEVQIAVKHPRPADWERQEVRNDDPSCSRFSGVMSRSSTGDIGRDVEHEIAPSLRPIHPRRRSHHGSLSSSSREFISCARAARRDFQRRPVEQLRASRAGGDRSAGSGRADLQDRSDGAVTVGYGWTRPRSGRLWGRRVFVRRGREIREATTKARRRLIGTHHEGTKARRNSLEKQHARIQSPLPEDVELTSNGRSIAVHRERPGLLRAFTFARCLELEAESLFEQEKPIPVYYRGKLVSSAS